MKLSISFLTFILVLKSFSALNSSLIHCQYVASLFQNSCNISTGQYPQSLNQVPARNVACNNIGNSHCVGIKNGNSCTWQKRLCVYCYMSGNVARIRIISDNLPNGCYNVPNIPGIVSAQNIGT